MSDFKTKFDLRLSVSFFLAIGQPLFTSYPATMETSSAWGAAPLFAAMFVLVVTVWSIALPALREDKDRASARWLALAALLSALASAIVGIEAIADQSEANAEAATLSANQIIGVVAVLGSFFTVGLGLPRVLWKLSKPRHEAKP